jgi:hypothetical protein
MPAAVLEDLHTAAYKEMAGLYASAPLLTG